MKFIDATARLAMARDWTKVSLLRYRAFDGYFATMHQAGNHWLRHILSEVLHRAYDAPPMRTLTDLTTVGTPKQPPRLDDVPRMVFSHRVCSPLIHSRIARATMPFPKTVILVRDLRAMLVSHYARYGHTYEGETFSDYVRGDVWGRRHNCDLWDSIRFLNVWGDAAAARPERFLALSYEDLTADPAGSAERAWHHFGFEPQDRSVFEEAVAASTKAKMAAKQAKSDKVGTVIRRGGGDPHDAFSSSDREWFVGTVERNLRRTFGYDYSTWRSQLVGDVGRQTTPRPASEPHWQVVTAH